MTVLLIIAGSIWFGLAAIFVLSLVCAARRGIPPPPEPHMHDITATTTQSSAMSSTQSETLTVRESGTPRPLEDEVVI